MRIPVFAANWKMNKYLSEIEPFIREIKNRLLTEKQCRVIIFPQFIHASEVLKRVQYSEIEVGVQNCGIDATGAYTGEVSPEAIFEIGCRWVILGHSERRHIFGESDELILKRINAALKAGLKVIFCVGEKLESRKKGETFQIIEKQLSIIKTITNLSEKLLIAYEPVWAIGTGETATPEQAEEVQAFIRQYLKENGLKNEAEKIPILYGGSTKPDNSQALMMKPNVDGLLVGGSSLNASTFADLIINGMKGIDLGE